MLNVTCLRDKKLGNLEQMRNALRTLLMEVADCLLTFDDALWQAVRFDIHAAATSVKF